MQKSHPILNIVKHLFFLLSAYSCITTQAQQPQNHHPADYIFTTYTASDGLISSEVISLTIDKKGYLWAGTAAGLSRYDGYAFTNFTYSGDDHFIGIVNVIKEDSAGKLWIGAGSGLFCYSQDRFIKVSAESKTPQGVNDIVVEKNGSLWLATEIGPVFINERDINTTGEKKVTLKDFVLPQWSAKFAAIDEHSCQLIKRSPDGAIYFSQRKRLYRFIANMLELVYTTKEENDKIGFILPVSRTKVFFDGAITGLNKAEDGKHTILPYKGVYQADRKAKSEGHWYVGSLGIVCFQPDEEFISTSISFKTEGVQWLSGILKENTIIWLATHNGLVKIQPSFFHLYTGDKYQDIEESFSFCQLRSGHLLTGVNRGKVYEILEDGVRYFFPGGQQPVPHAEIKSMYEDERGWLWIGTGYQGIAVYRKGQLIRFTSSDSKLHDNSFYSFVKTKNGKLFAIGDGGVTEILVDAKENISFIPYYYPPTFTAHAKFYGGVEGPDGKIWIAGEEGICFLQNDSLIALSLVGKNISVRSIKVAADSSVWIATAGDGVYFCRFDNNNKLQLVKQYKETNGLNTSQFMDVLIDNNDDVWAASAKGLTFIGRNGKNNGRIINFGEADGFIKPGYYSMTIFQDRQGTIWAGSPKGIASFQPGDLFVPTIPPKVYLSGIGFLKDVDKTLNGDSLITENSNHRLSLPYFNNSLSFNYTAIDHTAPGGIQYYYRMDGMDTGWTNAGYRRDITYHNLPAGDYTFKVKALNDKGTWSANEASFAFVINPPFWQTWWFRVLIVLALLTVVVFFTGRRIKIIKSKAAIKQQMTELEIKALRAQMNPHFIFNAMNSIQQFTLKNDTDNANRYISKFSALLRKVLHSSQQNYISLEEEVEQLRLYLDIEKLRMGDQFNYCISIDEAIEADAIKIPGMLVQPFAENAIKHGLALKEGAKQLDINFKLAGDRTLLITITDNGIGRIKAQQFKQQQQKLLPHESKGIGLAEERLKLLNYPVNNGSTIHIGDLRDTAGNAAGTTVAIELQLKE